MSDLFGDQPLQVSGGWPPDYQTKFWAAYPRRISKIAAMKALDKVRASGAVEFEDLMTAVERYKAWLLAPGWKPDAKHPATWLNKGCWDDELPPEQPRSPTFVDIGYGRRH